MKYSLYELLVFVALAPAACLAQHIEDPEEIDVYSPSFCTTNSDGFGGRPIGQGRNVDLSENTYFYELTISGGDVDSAIADLETRIADHLLSESGLFDICSRRLKAEKPTRLRKLQDGGAVAITTRPDDFPYPDVECSSASTLQEGQTCVVVEGGYGVFFDQGSVGVNALMMDINSAVQQGMDDGSFVGGDIESVDWTTTLQINNAGAANTGESATVRSVNNDNGSSTPIIIGASVGGIVAVGLIAFYRRRNMKHSDEDTFTTPAGGSAMS